MSRWVVVVALLACVLARSAMAASKQPDDGEVKKPKWGDNSTRLLDKDYFKSKGGAVAALGTLTLRRLQKKANLKVPLSKLVHDLENDGDMVVDIVKESLLYVCKGLALNGSQAEVASGIAPSLPDPSIPPSQAFSLSSRPAAIKKLYLDFTGHTTTNSTRWTDQGYPVIYTPPYDKDGNPGSFSVDELNDVIAVWRAVAEDYSPFEVDVTTLDPGNSDTNPNVQRIAIGGTYSDWYGPACAGVAQIGSFNTVNNPAFVFSTSLSNYPKYVWEATSHEAGHTFGLLHDGTATSSYYQGQGDWAPIMGSAYYKAITTFDKGEYAGSNNNQQDLAVINGYVPFIAQEAGNNAASALLLNASADPVTGLATVVWNGVISTDNGDWFSVSATAGTATLSVSVLAPWGGAGRSNLDVNATVYSSYGAVVATFNPAGVDTTTGLGVPSTTITLPANDTYDIAVVGVGFGDPATTGYSSYDIKGQYGLSITYTPCPGNCTAAPPTPPQPMRVTAITMRKSGSPYNCSATIVVRDANSVVLKNVIITGSWTMSPAGAATYSTSNSTATTNSYGQAVLRSPFITTASGSSCTIKIWNAVLPKYYLDTANSVSLQKTLSW